MIEQSTIQVSGKDAFAFLQGQLTCDMRELTSENHHAALCNNKGRVIVSMEIRQDQDNFLITLPKAVISILLKSLGKYARFSEVILEEINLNLPARNLLLDIQQKIAVILPETSGLYTPHELNYQNLNFISFNKGCYIGQEIIARMQYLGKLKKHLCYLKVESLIDLDQNIQIVNLVKCDETHYELLVVI